LATAAIALLLAAFVAAGEASAVLPPGYTPVPGTIPLNPADVGAVGSQFNQDCNGLPRPIQPGEVAWHFILPQAAQFDPSPTNVFDTLSVTFQTAGTVNLGAALSDFGPPSNAHAYIFTSTDDTLLAGTATIGRDLNAAAGRANDPQFNLSHTCVGPPVTTTTTAATTTTTTSAPTTTTSSSTTTTTAATTTSSGTPPTTGPTGSTTSTTAAVGPETTSESTAAATSAAAIPTTGGNGASPTNVALLALAVGSVLVVAARLRVSEG
jgi:hypothetical protein